MAKSQVHHNAEAHFEVTLVKLRSVRNHSATPEKTSKLAELFCIDDDDESIIFGQPLAPQSAASPVLEKSKEVCGVFQPLAAAEERLEAKAQEHLQRLPLAKAAELMGRVVERSATIKNPTGYVIKAARQQEREAAEQTRQTVEEEEKPWQTTEAEELVGGWIGEDPWQKEAACDTEGADAGPCQTTETEGHDDGWGGETWPAEGW